MDKNLIFVGVIVAVMGGGIWYQHRAPTSPSPVAAIAAAVGGKPAPAGGSVKPAAAPAVPAANDPDALKKQAARMEIEIALRAMKVSSIFLGDPAIVIISKEEYSVGSPLKLPGGKVLQVTAIDEGGVALGYQGQSFHLDAPGAPDLAATRKKL